MKKTIAMAAAAGLIAASGVYANAPSAPAQPKADPAKAQSIAGGVCVACHGVDGNSPLPANPKIGGQQAAYITKQLHDYKSGARKHPIMVGMVAALSPEDMLNLGAYYSGQKPNPGVTTDKALVAKGEKIYRGGITASGVPSCAGCHGQSALGIPAMYPRLSNQHRDYIEIQMKNFRTTERANDPGKMMQGVASRMSDADIQAVAEYLSSLN
ncbi:MAG: c-type cytochrome [Sulfuricellaceae bacterium]